MDAYFQRYLQCAAMVQSAMRLDVAAFAEPSPIDDIHKLWFGEKAVPAGIGFSGKERSLNVALKPAASHTEKKKNCTTKTQRTQNVGLAFPWFAWCLGG